MPSPRLEERLNAFLAERLAPLIQRPGMYYRVHPRGRPLIPAGANSQVFVYDELPDRVKEIVKPIKGYSVYANPMHLQEYVEEMGWADVLDDETSTYMTPDPVVRFEGKEVGRGYDGEPVVMPTSGILETISWIDFRDRLEVTPWDGTHRYEASRCFLAWGQDEKPEFKVNVIVKGPSRAASGKLISETGTTITIQPAAHVPYVTFDKSKVTITKLDEEGRKITSCRVLD